MTDLDKFRDAQTLRWNRWTLFTLGHGVDGTLYADDGPVLSLDTWTTAELATMPAAAGSPTSRPVTLPSGVRAFHAQGENEVVGVVADAADLASLHDTIRAWCRDVLGRDDVGFTVRAQDGTFESVDPVLQVG